MKPKDGYRMVKSAAADFMDDNAMTLGASLAFYSALSLAPLLVILITLASLLGSDTQGRRGSRRSSLPEAALVPPISG